MRKAYMAPINLIVAADNQAEACDAVAETLRELDTNVFADWKYRDNEDGSVQQPLPIGDIPDAADYGEGEVFEHDTLVPSRAAIECQTIAVISIAHLSHNTVQVLEDLSQARRPHELGPFVVESTDYGLRYMPVSPLDASQFDASLTDLAPIDELLCRAYRFDTILFDRDGDVVDGLPVHDW